tara:strand:- start:895 stop:1173 length:279 start_codon:yes stop_codon:yes gene_type:complete
MYKIIFNCDLIGNHKAKTLNLCCVDSIKFGDLLDALKFLDECTQPITKRSELHPSLQDYIYKDDEIFSNISSFELDKNIHQILEAEDFKSLL